MPTQRNAQPPRRGFPVLVGKYIHDVRRRRGMQQRELAALANVGQDALSRYESGIYTVSLKRIHAIARALRVPVDLLLPEIDFPDAVDRDLYYWFRMLWLEPEPIKALAAKTLRHCVELQILPLQGDCHAPRR